MEKIKSLSNPIWKGHAIEKIETLTSIRGGKMTTTKNATYRAAPGGGSFDDGSDNSNHEAIQ
ncbi:MAG: hypothetical protein IM631_21420 [Cytophagales bacterium]|nr:hypothetical protein [Cytophagales bacterium]MCA6373927.1 hypothetical protein [Cytophagales bacterium]MCA6377856.1 hypothetical protein [Cytophagales bacterium]MCA6385895.1 hypothetical protein [Cytophagales bacterium]